MAEKDVAQMIIEYLDGELPPNEEHYLFAVLSDNEEFRNLMREHLTLSRSIKTDLQSYQPPESATHHIFNSLGFTSTLPISKSSTAFPNIKEGNVSLWQKVKLPLFFSFVSAVLTFFATYFILNSLNTSKVEKVQAIVQTPPKIVVISESDEKPRPLESTKVSNNIQIVKEDTKSSNLLAENPTSTNYGLILDHSTNVNRGNDLSVRTLLNNKQSSDLIPLESLPYSPFMSNFVTSKSEQSFGVLVRHLTSWSFPDPDVPSTLGSGLSNVSLGIYFSQWDNVRFGIEIGKEPFGQRFKNIEEGVELLYEQKPTIYWAGVAFDYTFPYNLLKQNYLRPYITFLAGGSQVGGPLIKGLSGIRFKPANSPFDFFLGLEGSLLFYQNQGRFYSTQKFGLTYGMCIIF
ncbi:MAG: hypothetical protein N2517_00665 [Ignavibacteria bacterium]|nr:hypothetical protein [Ignavibacteria bacterium]